MRTPLQRTLINLAVASACGMLGAAHAQQTEPAQQPAADTQGASQPAQAPEAAPAVPEANVVRISGSRIAARGFSSRRRPPA
jgi:iron complex outermembrane receptor protein